jgi:hypothetical protein
LYQHSIKYLTNVEQKSENAVAYGMRPIFMPQAAAKLALMGNVVGNELRLHIFIYLHPENSRTKPHGTCI